MMPGKPSDFRVPPGAAVDLANWATRVTPTWTSKAECKKALKQHVLELSALQDKLYASSQYAVLVIFQAMDAAGKDGAIKHVMSGVNPQGCQVVSFKQPSSTERAHDFLWRTTRALPARGQIGIFNRSYYEEVLVARVHPDVLAAEGAPAAPGLWDGRYRSILDFEAHLVRNGTRVVKFFLHLSKEEQRQRFLRRIDKPEKNWKFSLADIEERRFWDAYMEAYAACIAATSTVEAPWHVVPADDKPTARLIVSQIILDALGGLGLAYPETSPERHRELLAIRKRLKA